MGFLLKFNLDSPIWLRSLRWIAIVGMTCSVLTAISIGIRLPAKPLFGLLLALAAFNLAVPAIEKLLGKYQDTVVPVQIMVDLVFLTLILWFSGGLVNPFATFYIFHVMIAGLLLSTRDTVVVACFSIVLLLLLIPAPPLVEPSGSIRLFDLYLWQGIPISLAILTFCTTGFILAFLHRLQIAQKENILREKMAALGRLVGGIAHEICTPLNSILLLAKDLEISTKDSEDKRSVGIIHSEAKRCGELVTLLLGYSRSSDAKVPSLVKSIQVKEWVRKIALNQTKKSDTLLEFHFDCPEELVFAELPFRQAFENILKNAVQATSGMHPPKICIKLNWQDERLEVFVVDNGEGFSALQKEKAFEAFFTTKADQEGTGLGLYVSYILLEQLGGRISISEAVTVGASVKIEIPASLPEGNIEEVRSRTIGVER